MKTKSKFEKISYNQFEKDFLSLYGQINGQTLEKKHIKELYKNLKVPKRATTGSAGYDFHIPESLYLKPGSSIIIPTGIRAYIEEGFVLQIYPRSGLGFKYKMQLDNTVGIIDSDYYFSDNEGHIKLKITKKGGKPTPLGVGWIA